MDLGGAGTPSGMKMASYRKSFSNGISSVRISRMIALLTGTQYKQNKDNYSVRNSRKTEEYTLNLQHTINATSR